MKKVTAYIHKDGMRNEILKTFEYEIENGSGLEEALARNPIRFMGTNLPARYFQIDWHDHNYTRGWEKTRYVYRNCWSEHKTYEFYITIEIRYKPAKPIPMNWDCLKGWK